MEEASGDVKVTRGPAYHVGLVKREALPLAWGIVREWIEAALAHSAQHELSVDDVWAGLCDDEYSLLLMGEANEEGEPGPPQACAVLTIAMNPRKRYLGMIAVGGGQLDTWLPGLFETCKRIAVQAGCEQIVAMGRPGWRRIMRPWRVHERATVLTYELTPADCARYQAGVDHG